MFSRKFHRVLLAGRGQPVLWSSMIVCDPERTFALHEMSFTFDTTANFVCCPVRLARALIG